jgi:alpha-galactosidase
MIRPIRDPIAVPKVLGGFAGIVCWISVASGLSVAHAARPTAEEMTCRDRWVGEYFPVARAIPPFDTVPPEAGLLVWTNLGPVFCNALPDKPLQIAGDRFERGLYCHAPSRIQVRLPAPAKSFSAIVGILTNPASQGGSVEFSVEVAEKRLATSTVKHRDEAGSPLCAELDGAQDFAISVGCAGDNLYSDQAVWGDAQVTLSNGTVMFLGDLPVRDPLTSARAITPLPFSFTYGGQHSDSLLPAWQFQEERDTSVANRIKRVRTYTDPGAGLTVRNIVVEYADFPTVEWTLSFKNCGSRVTPRIEGVLPLDLRIEREGNGEFLLHHFVGSPCQANDYEPLETTLNPLDALRISTDGGRPTNTHLPYFNVATGDQGGLIAVLGWAGQWAAQFTRDGDAGLRICGGQEATSFRLQPGEEVRSPMVVLQFYGGDWIRSQNVWRSWMLAHNVPRRDGKLLTPFIYGCTGSSYPGLKTDAATELQFFESYAKAGILPDYWDQDAGWYPCGDGWWNVGTWEVDRTRWPKGLREASDWHHAHGVKQIVWFEPERLAGGTWLAQNHPEWCFGGAQGGLMKLGDPDYRRWITDRIDQLITSEGIDFYRQDFNMDPLLSWRGSDADDRQGMAEIRHIEGYFALWDELVRRHPQLWIDSCASGGRRNDLETLRRAVPILRSDYVGNPQDPNYDPFCHQNHIFGISFWMPYHGSGFEHIDTYWARSVMMGPIVGIGIDTRKSGWDLELVRKLRRQIQQVQRCYLGDYSPLTTYSKDAGNWAAFQFDLPDAGEGVVHAFRRKDCPQQSVALKLHGLEPEARYLVRDIDSDETREVPGRELQETGLQVTADKPQTALIFMYRRQP